MIASLSLSQSSRAEHWALITCLICGGLLCVALYMEYAMGLAPCPLCMMQRLWVVIVGLLAWGSVVHNPRWGIYPLLGILASIVGGGFSIRQLHLQSLPADQVPACGPDLNYMLEVFPLSDVLVAMTQGTGDCATVSWSLFGISIPGWTLIGFVLLVASNVAHLRSVNR